MYGDLFDGGLLALDHVLVLLVGLILGGLVGILLYVLRKYRPVGPMPPEYSSATAMDIQLLKRELERVDARSCAILNALDELSVRLNSAGIL